MIRKHQEGRRVTNYTRRPCGCKVDRKIGDALHYAMSPFCGHYMATEHEPRPSKFEQVQRQEVRQ